MTTIINYVTTNFTSSTPYNAISNGMAVITILLLLGLLTEKVLLDAYENKPIEFKTKAFMIGIFPLLFVLLVAIFLRMAQILQL